MTADNDLRWSTGLRGSPQDYIRIGRLLELANGPGPDLTGLDATPAEEDLLGQVLDELTAEDEALRNWAEGGDPAIDSVLNAMLADPAEMPYLDDLSNSGAGTIDLSGYEAVSRTIDLVNGTYGPGTAERLAASGAPRTIGMLANDIDRSARSTALEQFGKSRGGNRRAEGDVLGLMEAYARVGTAGHDVELANQGGYDARAIELARYSGRFASICGPADHFARCSSAYHDPGCSHVAEAGAAYGARPEDAAAWRDAMASRAGLPFADADGRVWRNGHGQAATLADHIESRTGQRQAGVEFHVPRDRGELAAIESVRVLADPNADPGEAYPAGFAPGTAATARALAAQAHLPVSAGAARQRQAWQHEHAQRVADRAARTSGRVHPDYAESTRERADRMHQPVALSNVSGEDLLGALPSFTYGQI